MKKKGFAAVLASALLSLIWTLPAAAPRAARADETSLPSQITYEYTGEESILPVYVCGEGESFRIEVKDGSENLLAENVLFYTFELGKYYLDYTVYSVSGGETSVKTYRVQADVKDLTPPVITVRGEYPSSYKKGDVLVLAEGSAYDSFDGEVACTVAVYLDGKPIALEGGKLTETGEYTVVYTAKDSFGNKTEKKYSFEVPSEKKKSGGSVWVWLSVGLGAAVVAAAGVVVTALIRR